MKKQAANHGFLPIKNSLVKDLDIKVQTFEHKVTGAKLVYVQKDDENKTFGVTFKTIPQDSSGVAHILEHVVLCGSKNYPVKDPFFSMLKRSLQNFMNALTSNDWTMYPFSTVNDKDFFNLMDVYLDAAFFPNISKHSFLQEGWRLELSDQNDLNSKLLAKGVVFNEMKGAMSSQDSIMMQRSLSSIFTNNAYKYNSGGEPVDIIGLSWDDLKNFHKTYYHPSNALFFLYGKLPLERCLDVISHKVLRFFKDKLPVPKVSDALRYKTPKHFKFSYPKDVANPDSHQVALAWLNKPINDFDDVALLKILSSILLKDSGALLKKPLIESKLGSSLADATGYHSDLKETFFLVGLKGVKGSDLDKVEKLISKTILDIANSDIPQERIDSAIHSFELSLRDLGSSSYPLGLVLLFSIVDPWLHGLDPVFLIDFPAQLERIKAKLKDKSLLINMIKENLINNQHRVRIDLAPDDKYLANQERAIENKISTIKSKSTKDDILSIQKMTKQLAKNQTQKDDLSVLPKVTIADIQKNESSLKKSCVSFLTSRVNSQNASSKITKAQSFDDSEVVYYALSTNKMCYLNLEFALPDLNLEEQSLLPILGKFMIDAGTAQSQYDKMALKISRYSAGVSASPDAWVVFGDNLNSNNKALKVKGSFSLSTKCLVENVDPLTDILDEILTKYDFNDLSRIQDILTQRADQLSVSLLDAGHRYAMGKAAGYLHSVCALNESYSGISQIMLSKKLAKFFKADLPNLNNKLAALAGKIFAGGKKRLWITAPPDSQASIVNRTKALTMLHHQADSLPQADFLNITKSFSNKKEIYLTATPVSYVARVFKTFSMQHKLSPTLLVLSRLLRWGFLHREIREIGGAYGALSNYDSETGLFYFGSYRDPNLTKTWDVFTKSLQWAMSGDFSQDDLESAIIQVFSMLDAPLGVSQQALRDYSYLERNITQDFRNKYRKQILNTTKDALVKAAFEITKCDFADVAISSEEICRKEKLTTANKNEFNIVKI